MVIIFAKGDTHNFNSVDKCAVCCVRGLAAAAVLSISGNRAGRCASIWEHNAAGLPEMNGKESATATAEDQPILSSTERTHSRTHGREFRTAFSTALCSVGVSLNDRSDVTDMPHTLTPS